MRGVRRARLQVLHLLRVAVVCRDEQDVPRLLRGLVYRSDRRVRFGDRLDCGFIDSSVADL